MSNNNIPIEKTIVAHYVGPAEVVEHYSRFTKDNEEVLKIQLILKNDFFSVKLNEVLSNHTEECTVYGRDTNHIQYKKKLKEGDIIHVKLDYEFTKNKFHDYIIRDSTLVNPAFDSKINSEDNSPDDTLGNWM